WVAAKMASAAQIGTQINRSSMLERRPAKTTRSNVKSAGLANAKKAIQRLPKNGSEGAAGRTSSRKLTSVGMAVRHSDAAVAKRRTTLALPSAARMAVRDVKKHQT